MERRNDTLVARQEPRPVAQPKPGQRAQPGQTAPRLHGVIPVLATPFLNDGGIDEHSLRREIDFVIAEGAQGLVIFGLASEIYKLTDDDRRRIIEVTVEHTAGRIPVIAGTEHTGFEGAIERNRLAAALGVDAVMIYPPTFVKPDAAGVVEYYTEISSAIDIPIVVQDAPGWTGIPMPVPLLTELSRKAPRAQYVKIEAPPTGPKITQLLQAGQQRMQVIGGYGGLYFLEELRRGVVGTMPGPAVTWELGHIYHDFQEGRIEQAEERFYDVLPFLVFAMSSLDACVEIHKRVLVKAGVLESAHLRRPASRMDAQSVAELERLLERVPLHCLTG